VAPVGPEPFVGISKSTARRSMGALARQWFHQAADRWPQCSEN